MLYKCLTALKRLSYRMETDTERQLEIKIIYHAH